MTSHECIGAARCRYADTCFAEKARDEAKRADVVVTNHAMLAIDAVSGIPLLPEHDVVIVDEGHELVDRVTGAITDELTASLVQRAARRAKQYVTPEQHDLLLTASSYLEDALDARGAGADRAGQGTTLRRPRRRQRCLPRNAFRLRQEHRHTGADARR